MAEKNISELTERMLTSIKVPKAIYEDFRALTKLNKMYLQDLTERSMFLYITDSEFRHKIHSTYSTYYTGSVFVDEVKMLKVK
jgi:hypothetical protein